MPSFSEFLDESRLDLKSHLGHTNNPDVYFSQVLLKQVRSGALARVFGLVLTKCGACHLHIDYKAIDARVSRLLKSSCMHELCDPANDAARWGLERSHGSQAGRDAVLSSRGTPSSQCRYADGGELGDGTVARMHYAAIRCAQAIGRAVQCANCDRWPNSFGAECKCPGKLNADTNVFGACAACKGVVYCSRACQEAHWSVHSRQCEETRALLGT